MGVRHVTTREILEVGRALFELRAQITTGEVIPPWPVSRRMIPNHILVERLDPGRKTGLRETKRSGLFLSAEFKKKWRVSVMGITKCGADRTSHGNRTKGELVILVVPPSGAGKTFRCSIDRKKFNGASLREALEVVKGYIDHEYGWNQATKEG